MHNGENFIEDALNSIACQSFKDYVVFVSNNASTDRTAEIVRRYSNDLPITMVCHATKKSMIDNFLYAFDQVRTPYFLFLSHDDYLNAPDAIQLAVDVLERYADVSSVYSDLSYVNARRVSLMQRRFKRSGVFSGEDIGRASVKAARNLFGIPLLIRSTALAQLRVDHRLTYVGDVDFSWQISQTGPIYHIPRTLFANRFGSHNNTWPIIIQAARQFTWLAEKHGMHLSNWQRVQLFIKGWALSKQKRLFGLYAQMRSRL